MPSDLSNESIILLLRGILVVLLYLFLFSLVLLIQRELRAESAPRRAGSPRSRLIVVEPGTSSRPPGQAVALEPVTRVGRTRENTLVLDDEFVSSSHALVLLRDGRWWVRDQGSTNGTLVNGGVIKNETPLRNGDELQVGGVRLKLEA